MKIAFDFHGVLEKYPVKFKQLMKSFDETAEIIVLSGPPKEQVFDELTNAGYIKGEHYHRIISVVDWIKSQGFKMWQNENKSWQTDDKTWWSSKGSICYDEQIGILFDDKLEYKKYMPGDSLFFHVI